MILERLPLITKRSPTRISILLKTIWDYFQLFAFFYISPEVWKTIQKVHKEKLTYLSRSELLNLTKNVRRIIKQDVKGIFVEAGCALGGSALTIAVSKTQERPFYIYDTFEMIPPPTSNDGEDAHQRYKVIEAHEAKGVDSTLYYGYIQNLYDRVYNSFVECGLKPEDNQIILNKGLFQNTLNIDEPVALAHLDCDWYDSVMVCLQQIEPHLSMGGKLIVDDYNYWSGCKKAVDEYFAGERRMNYSFSYSSHLIITRIH